MYTPNVFVSYSHDGITHENWVLKLATDLRSHGVNVVLDQWDLRLGTDLRFFMEGLSHSNMVLCICSEQYVNKVDKGHGGSGYEGMIMTQALLKNQNLDYVIPIIRNNPQKKMPLAFGSKNYIDFSDDESYFSNYQKLLERICDEDIKKKPPLGQSPFSSAMAQKIDVKTKLESVKYSNPSMEGTVTFRFDNNNGVYQIGSGEYLFKTRWSRSGNNSIHAYGRLGFNSDFCDFPSYEELELFDFTSTSRTIRTNQILILENDFHHFAAIKMGEVKSSSHGNTFDEMTFEYTIYQR